MVDIPLAAGKASRTGRPDWSLSFTLQASPSDAFYAAVLSASVNGTPLHLAVADYLIDTATAKYWEAWWVLTEELTGNLDTAASVNVSLMPDAGKVLTEGPREVVVA